MVLNLLSVLNFEKSIIRDVLILVRSSLVTENLCGWNTLGQIGLIYETSIIEIAKKVIGNKNRLLLNLNIVAMRRGATHEYIYRFGDQRL